ncbi:MAG: hypothetical protein ACRCUY_11215 [Thermoguttaceae bacterium]
MLTLLCVFFTWYGLSWAYTSLYKEPRDQLSAKIAQFQSGIENGKKNIAFMEQGILQNQPLYYRSLPRVQNEARSLYSFWILELLKFSEFDLDGGEINPNPPTATSFGANYRFYIRGKTSLANLSRLLYEFSFAPFLHRITSMNIAPVEGDDGRVAVSMTIDAVAVRPASPQDAYPLMNMLPVGVFQRLKSNDLAAYQVIADRNLLQVAKGGVDKSDFAYLTAINEIDQQLEIWFSIRTDNSIFKARKGDAIRIGSFSGKIADIQVQDIVIERNGMQWLLALGECLNQASALPSEANCESEK